jgi:hypothetical protein
MLNDILNIVRGAHQLYNSGDPDYYRNMAQNPHSMMMGGYGGYGGYGGNNMGSSNSTFGQVANGLGNVLSTIAPMVHQYRNYGHNKAMANSMYYPMGRNMGRPSFTGGPSHMRYNLPSMNTPRPHARYSFDNPSPAVQREQQGELNYWNQKKELDHWNNMRDQGNANIQSINPDPNAARNFSNIIPPVYNNNYSRMPDFTGADSFAKGGPAKQYYVREKMPGYDVGRIVPHTLANLWNPRLDPMGVAGNVIGGEAARAGANYGINRLMGTDGHRWSNPRELTRAERLGRFFTHRIPKTINKTFGTSFDTGHGKYWNAAKGLPPAIANNPGLLEAGVGALGNRALNLGSRVHEGIKGLGGVAYNQMDNIIPQIEDMGSKAYNALPEIRKPIEQRVNHAASSISPFSRSGMSPWDMDPNFKEEEQKQSPSYLSQMYNSLPNFGISDMLMRNKHSKESKSGQIPMTVHETNMHLREGMKPHYPNTGIKSKTDEFMDEMLGRGLRGGNPYAGDSGMNDNDEFFDARDEYDPSYHARLAGGGYTGNIAPDEFVHRRHHRVNEPNDLDQMIRAYIQHMMEEQARGTGQGEE